MSNTKTAQKNGQEVKEVKPIAKGNATQESQKMSETKINDLINPTASARIKKLENFQILAKKHDFLIAKQNELTKFIISSDGTKEKVILKNASGFELEVSASQVVEKVLYVIQEELSTFIEKSEKEVLSFNI